MTLQLESFAPATIKFIRSRHVPFKSVLNYVGEILVRVLVPSREPVITYICTQNGLCFWQIYDPISQQTFRRDTELEVLECLESLPYF